MSRRTTAVKNGVLGTLALALLALPDAAQAADYGSSDNWSGFYIGVHAGYGFFNADNSGAGQSWTQDGHGFTGGVFTGYNMDFGDYVLGIEADTTFGDMDNNTPIAGLGNVQVAFHGQHTLRIRAGMDLGSSLLYATGGLAMSDIWLKGSGARDDHFLWGGVAGAGYEVKVTEDFTVRAEYLYAIFADQTYQLASPVSVDFETHSIRAGVAWQF